MSDNKINIPLVSVLIPVFNAEKYLIQALDSILMGADPAPGVPLLPAVSSVAMKKAPGRTEFQRGIVSQVDGHSSVRPAGAQGSGVLRSMSEANCFIVLEHDRGQVAVGDLVQVQLFDGLV